MLQRKLHSVAVRAALMLAAVVVGLALGGHVLHPLNFYW
jgi:hypothetical protein